MIYQHTTKKSDDIVVIPIDTQMMNELQANNHFGAADGSLRIPKSWYLEVIDMLEEAWVKAIGIDIIFQNRDEYEKQFAEELRKYDNIVLATQLDSGWGSCQKDNINESNDVIGCENSPRSIYTGTTWGFVNNPDTYATLAQSVPPIYYDIPLHYPETILESFTLAVYRKYIGEKTPGTISTWSMLNIGKRNIPLIENDKYINTYFWLPRSYILDEWLRRFGKKWVDMNTGISSTGAVGILGLKNYKPLLKKTFEGKIVLIGEDGSVLHDTVNSPYAGIDMPGVELHANMLDGIIQNKLLREFSGILYYVFIGILTILSILGYYLLPKFISPLLAGILFVAVIFFGRYMYDVQRIVISIIPVFVATILSFPLTFIYRFFIVDREKRELQKNFGHYVDPHVVEQIADNDEDIILGGEHKDVTVLFSDIAGFTTISEKLEATDLFSLMTSYLSNMTNILIEQGWTLDKYIGDAVMGFFGAPLALPDHAIRGCRTALLMRERLPAFNADTMKHGMDPIDFRVGMASGDVMVGNIGSQDRFNYTILGDTVNLASRLEGTGKEYNVHIILSHGTRTGLSDEFFVRELDTIAVKGKTEGVRIYELIGFTKNIIDRTIYENYEKALSLYREEKYIDAGKIWESQKDVDPPSRIMMDRCLSLIHGETHLENGVYHMTHK